ncbi:hypothetical protein MMC18_005335 [Xylographa bjoerkii]|nr:hypothetical protein [Xylographa bjoerkii]
MGRPRAARSLSEHNVKGVSDHYYHDFVPNLSIPYGFSDAENIPGQAWLSPTETHHSFDMVADRIDVEKSNHFGQTTDITGGYRARLPSRSSCAEDFPENISMSFDHDHEPTYNPTGLHDHTDLRPGFDQSLRQDGHMAEVFLKLSSLQFDLQRRREKLMGAESDHNFITRAAELDSMMCIIGDVCHVTRDLLSQGAAWKLHESKQERLLMSFESSPATFMLILTIVLEALNIYEVLVRNSNKEDPVTLAPRSSYEISVGASSTLPRTLSSAVFPATPESCSSSSDRDAARGTTAPPSMAFAIGSFMTCQYLNEVLVLTTVDLHLSIFDCFFHRFKNQSLAPSVLSSVDAGKTRTSQLRLEIKTLIEVSKQCWNSA